MFKVNNRNTRTRCEICSKLTIKTPERRQWLGKDVWQGSWIDRSYLTGSLSLALVCYVTPEKKRSFLQILRYTKEIFRGDFRSVWALKMQVREINDSCNCLTMISCPVSKPLCLSRFLRNIIHELFPAWSISLEF